MTRTLPLASASIGSTLEAVVHIASPAGDPVVIDMHDQLTVTATPDLVRLGRPWWT